MQDMNLVGATGGYPSTKKKRNRKRKNKEGKLTAEEIHSMPTDDLCNYIENKANQNDPNATAKVSLNGVPGHIAGVRGSSKIKKRGQAMSIEDQETKSIE